MVGKTILKTSTVTRVTKNYQGEARVELKPTSNNLDISIMDGHLMSSSSAGSPDSNALFKALHSSAEDGGPKLADFEILYDPTNPVFTWGDTITGKLRIVLRESMKMRLIKLQFKGRAGVGWAEGGAKTKSEQVFFDKEIVLLERRPGQEVPADFVLPAGIHVLPFIFPLPKNLPTSLEGAHGSIRYYCRAVIVKPWKHDHVTKRAFTVLSPRSAERDPDLMKGIVVADGTALSSMCCMNGQVACEVSLPKQVYAPGELITVEAKITNTSRRQVTKATVALVQLTTHRVVGEKAGVDKIITSARAVAERVIDKPLRDGKMHWNQEPMFRVPSIPPTLVEDWVATVRVEYELRVQLTVSGDQPNDALLILVPVTIVLASSSGLLHATNGGAPFGANKSTTKYVDAVFGRSPIREDDENDYVRGQLEFAPLYPVIET